MANILDVADQNGQTFKYYLDRATANANSLNSAKLETPTGTADSTTYASGDGTYSVPPDTINPIVPDTTDNTKAAKAVEAETLVTDFVLNDSNIPDTIARDSELPDITGMVTTGSVAVLASVETTGGNGESRIELVNNTSYTPSAGEYSIFFEGGVLKMSINGAKFSVGQVGVSYLISQDFEGVGYNNETWTSTGTVNPDYITDPIVGEQSINISDNGIATSPTFVSQSNIWARVAVRIDTLPTGDAAFFKLRNAADDTIIALYSGSGGALSVGSSAGKIFSDTVFQATPNVVYLWLHYTSGTGANGICEVHYSSDGNKPESAAVYNKTYPGTDPISKIILTATEGSNIVFDQITVSGTELGDF